MTFPVYYNLTKPREEDIRCVQCKKELYDLGIAEASTLRGNIVRVYSIECTLCDILRPHCCVDIQVVTEAFKRFITRIDKNIPVLSEYAKIKNIAKEKHISAQLVMQNSMLERLLERISVSKYQ